MIVDAFLFDNEWDCLDMRLRELDGLVDRVVLVEGTRTHQGAPRRLLDQCLLDHSMLGLQAGLVHVIAEVPEQDPDTEAPPSVARAIIQRNAILDGLDGVPDDALVMISDVDEIPRRQDFEKAIDLWRSGHVMIAFMMDLFYYRLNLRDSFPWWGPRAIQRGSLGWPHNVRRHYRLAEDVYLEKSGWHYSWLGSTEDQLEKIGKFSHPELNTPEIRNAEFLETCRRLRMVAHNGHLLERIEVDDSFPLLVQEDPDRFSSLVEPP